MLDTLHNSCCNYLSAGLDPARFAFTDAPPDARLDKSDAMFVDVIHTDIGKWGLEQPVGHVDFYPNGGASQAGCEYGNDKLSLWSKSSNSALGCDALTFHCYYYFGIKKSILLCCPPQPHAPPSTVITK